jgi:hypothetical protein
MARRILVYGTPVYLYLLEVLLRTLASVKMESVAGPTIAAAGIGFLIPLFQLKQAQIDPKLQKQIDSNKFKVIAQKDDSLLALITLSFVLSLAAWMYSLFLVIKPLTDEAQSSLLSIAIGSLVFIVSIALSEIKDRP